MNKTARHPDLEAAALALRDSPKDPDLGRVVQHLLTRHGLTEYEFTPPNGGIYRIALAPPLRSDVNVADACDPATARAAVVMLPEVEEAARRPRRPAMFQVLKANDPTGGVWIDNPQAAALYSTGEPPIVCHPRRVGRVLAESPIGTVVAYAWGGRHYQARYVTEQQDHGDGPIPVLVDQRRHWLGIGPRPFWTDWKPGVPAPDQREACVIVRPGGAAPIAPVPDPVIVELVGDHVTRADRATALVRSIIGPAAGVEIWPSDTIVIDLFGCDEVTFDKLAALVETFGTRKLDIGADRGHGGGTYTGADSDTAQIQITGWTLPEERKLAQAAPEEP